MKAFVVTAPKTFEIQDVAEPKASAGEIVAKIERVGICGTDVEFFNGVMPYLHDGQQNSQCAWATNGLAQSSKLAMA